MMIFLSVTEYLCVSGITPNTWVFADAYKTQRWMDMAEDGRIFFLIPSIQNQFTL